MSGFELCKIVRTFSSLPIIFLTARDEEINTIVGLEIGGDDYMTKPFSPRELGTRIKTVLCQTANDLGQGRAKPADVCAVQGKSPLDAQGRTSPNAEKAHLPTLGASEMSALGAALEEMQAKLDGKNYIEDYVRALTHEMKSPLTGIKGAGEILRDHVADPRGCKFLDNIDAEVMRLQSLVERMLQLSRLENVRTVTKAPVYLFSLLQGLNSVMQNTLCALGRRARSAERLEIA